MKSANLLHKQGFGDSQSSSTVIPSNLPGAPVPLYPYLILIGDVVSSYLKVERERRDIGGTRWKKQEGEM